MKNTIMKYDVSGLNGTHSFYDKEKAEAFAEAGKNDLRKSGYHSLIKNVEIKEFECGYVNEFGYSDVYPYEIVRVVSDITLEIRPMLSKLDPDFECDVTIGGFVGHTNNNHAQSYTYTSNPKADIIRVRLNKYGKWMTGGRRFTPSTEPYKFYDYNF